MLQHYLFLQQSSEAGRGVFTHKKIAAETIIEISPVIVMNSDDRIYLDKTKLHNYIFEWGEDASKCCMALGFVPMYNHSYSSNCEYFMDFEKEIIFIKTVRAIKKGEQLTLNYNGDWNDKKPIWFEAL